MSHSENTDYEIVKKSFLHHNIKKSMQSQTAQIVVNLIFNDNVHLMILESTLFSLKQQAVVNSSSNKQMLILCSCFNNYDDDFLKKIRVKKSANYYNKFFYEHNE